MSQIMQWNFRRALAVSATFGAAQLASGHDLIGRRQRSPATAPEEGVNRTAKADRAAVRVAPARTGPSRSGSTSLADTSVLVRVPVAKEEARNRPVAPR